MFRVREGLSKDSAGGGGDVLCKSLFVLKSGLVVKVK